MTRRLVGPADPRGEAARKLITSDTRAELIARWTGHWRAEDADFDIRRLIEWAEELEDDILGLLLLPPGQRPESEELRSRLGASGRSLALALRDPQIAHLVDWPVCRSGEPSMFDVFISLLLHPGETWSSPFNAAECAVRLYDHDRLPTQERETLLKLLDHESSRVRENVARALRFAFVAELPEPSSPPSASVLRDALTLRDALADRASDPVIGPFAIQSLRRVPDKARLSSLRAAVADNPTWWLLGCLAACGDMEPAVEHFDSVPPDGQCELADIIMTARNHRAFLIERLRDDSAPLQLRERILTLFSEWRLYKQVAKYESLIQLAREREEAKRLAELELLRKSESAKPSEPAPDEHEFRVFRHPQNGTWKVAITGCAVQVRFISLDGETVSRSRPFETYPDAKKDVETMIAEQLADGYVEERA